MGDIHICIVANALEFAIAGGCKHEGFDYRHSWDFQEGNVKVRVDLEVLGLV